MKALTVYQPWASLILVGAKPYEFRGWNPRERGGAYAALIGERIVIHASARPVRKSEVDEILVALEKGGDEAAVTCLKPDLALPILRAAASLPLAAGLGTAVLGEPKCGFDVAAEFGLEMHVNDSDRDEYSNWGWPMLEIDAWAEPVAMRGLQGFWNWPSPADVGL